MVVSVVQSIGIFFLLDHKKLVVGVVFAMSRDFLVLKHVLKKTVHILQLLRWARSKGLNVADLCDRKIEEGKTDSML